MAEGLNITILGLSITSSWGNGHATTFRGLVRELTRQGHQVTFLERDVPWYRDNRDLPNPPYGKTILYGSLEELYDTHAAVVRDADAVIVGSYVPDGIEVGRWVLQTAKGLRAFYDIDTPVTLARLAASDCAYLSVDLIRGYDLYLSFTGGPTLRVLESKWGSPCAKALYCSVDPELYKPAEGAAVKWDLGYLGTYSRDRQPPLQRLMLDAAGQLPDARFVVAGPQYPEDIAWPGNVERVQHLPPSEHAGFYTAQRFTLNITRADMIAAGWSPSVRLFEAAACAAPIISDVWDGIETLLKPGREIVLARSTADTVAALSHTPEDARVRMGELARERILKEHTAAHRAEQLVEYVQARRARLAAKASGAR